MAKKLKYRKGAQVETVMSAVLAILDERPMYYGAGVAARSLWETSTIAELRVWVDKRRIWFAVKNDA